MDFSHLQKLDVADKTARFTVYQIQGEPVLILKPANEANKPYFNAVLKRSRRNVRAIQAGHVNQVMIAETREKDRELFSKFVIVGWENVQDVNGEQVPFSSAACEEFLRALPNWLFDEIRNFAGMSLNFTEDAPNVEEAAGNL
jgi:hypothetical protein